MSHIVFTRVEPKPPSFWRGWNFRRELWFWNVTLIKSIESHSVDAKAAHKGNENAAAACQWSGINVKLIEAETKKRRWIKNFLNSKKLFSKQIFFVGGEILEKKSCGWLLTCWVEDLQKKMVVFILATSKKFLVSTCYEQDKSPLSSNFQVSLTAHL